MNSSIRFKGLPFVVVLAAALLACGSSGASATGGGRAATSDDVDAGSGPSSDGFSLVVSDARLERIIGALQPAVGNVYVDVGITLTNDRVPTPIPDGSALFSLVTTSNLVYPASPASEALSPTCPTVMLAEGGTVSCRVAFEVPTDAVPLQLQYASPGADLAAAAAIPSVTPLPAATCLDWTHSDGELCIDCVSGAGAQACSNDFVEASGGACSPECTMFFPNGLARECTALPPTCSPSAQCQSAVDALDTCLANACDSVCL